MKYLKKMKKICHVLFVFVLFVLTGIGCATMPTAKSVSGKSNTKENAADYLGCRTAKPSGKSFSAYAILGVNAKEACCVGCEALVLTKGKDGKILTEAVSDQDKTVYESLGDCEALLGEAERNFGYPRTAAVEISNLPVEPMGGQCELIVRPYVLLADGIRRYGKAATLSYRGEKDGEARPILVEKEPAFYRVEATDDTFIFNIDGQVESDFGDSKILQTKNFDVTNADPQRAAYFKFTLSQKETEALRTAAFAKLNICVQNFENNAPTTPYEMTVYAAGTDWDEHNLNYKTHAARAPLGEYIGQTRVEDDLYFEMDILDYALRQPLNKDGSLTVAFRVTNEGHEDAKLIYLHSKESKLGLVPFIQIVSTMYNLPLELPKIANEGYEPWGYAEHLADEWFGGLKDAIRPTDENGTPVYHETKPFDRVGYGATEVTGDYCSLLPWTQLEWSEDKANAYQTPPEQWTPSRYARTLRTLGTSTGNAFLDSKYAVTAEYDVYGGITNAGFTGEKTGFFHIEHHNGRRYVIDPLGNPFFVISMNDVGIGRTENQKRYTMEAFGSKEAFFEAMTASLKEMGVNVAQVSHDNPAILAVKDGLSVVESFSSLGGYMNTLGRRDLTSDGFYAFNNTRAVFDPDYARYTKKVVAASVKENGYADNPRIFGYTADNELPSELHMLSNYLTLDPLDENTNAFSYAAAWAWLARRMNDPYPTLEKYRSSPEKDAINREFMGFWYARYYRTVSEAIHAVDPNHMYIGSRANLNSLTEEWCVRAAGYYLDMITANLYGGLHPSIDTITNLYRYSGKPFIVTEFFAKASDAIDANGYKLANSIGAGILVQTQQGRADYYEHYTLALLESQACVGWTWYRFLDNDQSLYVKKGENTPMYMWAVRYGVGAHPLAFRDGAGNTYSAEEIGEYERIYSGDGIHSNQNVNKGVYNNNFHSAVSVYTYDKTGKLTASMSYEVQKPNSEMPCEGTVLKALKGDASYTVGRTQNPDGGYTETMLTVYEGKYLALASAIRRMSGYAIGLVNYFDER